MNTKHAIDSFMMIMITVSWILCIQEVYSCAVASFSANKQTLDWSEITDTDFESFFFEVLKARFLDQNSSTIAFVCFQEYNICIHTTQVAKT